MEPLSNNHNKKVIIKDIKADKTERKVITITLANFSEKSDQIFYDKFFDSLRNREFSVALDMIDNRGADSNRNHCLIELFKLAWVNYDVKVEEEVYQRLDISDYNVREEKILRKLISDFLVEGSIDEGVEKVFAFAQKQEQFEKKTTLLCQLTRVLLELSVPIDMDRFCLKNNYTDKYLISDIYSIIINYNLEKGLIEDALDNNSKVPRKYVRDNNWVEISRYYEKRKEHDMVFNIIQRVICSSIKEDRFRNYAISLWNDKKYPLALKAILSMGRGSYQKDTLINFFERMGFDGEHQQMLRLLKKVDVVEVKSVILPWLAKITYDVEVIDGCIDETKELPQEMREDVFSKTSRNLSVRYDLLLKNSEDGYYKKNEPIKNKLFQASLKAIKEVKDEEKRKEIYSRWLTTLKDQPSMELLIKEMEPLSQTNKISLYKKASYFMIDNGFSHLVLEVAKSCQLEKDKMDLLKNLAWRLKEPSQIGLEVIEETKKLTSSSKDTVFHYAWNNSYAFDYETKVSNIIPFIKCTKSVVKAFRYIIQYELTLQEFENIELTKDAIIESVQNKKLQQELLKKLKVKENTFIHSNKLHKKNNNEDNNLLNIAEVYLKNGKVEEAINEVKKISSVFKKENTLVQVITVMLDRENFQKAKDLTRLITLPSKRECLFKQQVKHINKENIVEQSQEWINELGWKEIEESFLYWIIEGLDDVKALYTFLDEVKKLSEKNLDSLLDSITKKALCCYQESPHIEGYRQLFFDALKEINSLEIKQKVFILCIENTSDITTFQQILQEIKILDESMQKEVYTSLITHIVKIEKYAIFYEMAKPLQQSIENSVNQIETQNHLLDFFGKKRREFFIKEIVEIDKMSILDSLQGERFVKLFYLARSFGDLVIEKKIYQKLGVDSDNQEHLNLIKDLQTDLFKGNSVGVGVSKSITCVKEKSRYLSNTFISLLVKRLMSMDECDEAYALPENYAIEDEWSLSNLYASIVDSHLDKKEPLKAFMWSEKIPSKYERSKAHRKIIKTYIELERIEEAASVLKNIKDLYELESELVTCSFLLWDSAKILQAKELMGLIKSSYEIKLCFKQLLERIPSETVIEDTFSLIEEFGWKKNQLELFVLIVKQFPKIEIAQTVFEKIKTIPEEDCERGMRLLANTLRKVYNLNSKSKSELLALCFTAVREIKEEREKMFCCYRLFNSLNNTVIEELFEQVSLFKQPFRDNLLSSELIKVEFMDLNTKLTQLIPMIESRENRIEALKKLVYVWDIQNKYSNEELEALKNSIEEIVQEEKMKNEWMKRLG